MSLEFKSINHGKSASYERKLVQLNDDNDDVNNIEFNNQFEDKFPDPCKQIIDQIRINQVMTIEQLNTILKFPQSINQVHDNIYKIDFILENEFEMIKSCLKKISEDSSFITLVLCLFRRCKTKEVKDFVLSSCYNNINNLDYSQIISTYADAYPCEDIWDWILKMDQGFEYAAMNLLSNKIFPKDKTKVINKIKANPTQEDVPLLNLLNLTNDEFDKENIYQYLLHILNLSRASAFDTQEVKISEIYRYIGSVMIKRQIVYKEIIVTAIQLISEGSMFLKEESIKFLYLISTQVTNLPKETFLFMIQNNAIENIIDMIDTDSLITPINCSLCLLLIFLTNNPKEALCHIDVSYLIELLNSINSQLSQQVIDKISNVIQTLNDPEP